MTIELFLTDVDGQVQGFTKEFLEEQGIDNVQEAFAEHGGGVWHKVHTVSTFSAGHHEKVETKLLERDPQTGQFWRNTTKFYPNLIEVAVTSWDLTWPLLPKEGEETEPLPHTAEGMRRLPVNVAQLIGALVEGACYLEKTAAPFRRA